MKKLVEKLVSMKTLNHLFVNVLGMYNFGRVNFAI